MIAVMTTQLIVTRTATTGSTGGHFPVGQQLWKKEMKATATAPIKQMTCAMLLMMLNVAIAVSCLITSPCSSLLSRSSNLV